ncbi:MAG: hypothetical protein ACPL0A_00700 [Candidatus Micrarchaeia archaeon]
MEWRLEALLVFLLFITVLGCIQQPVERGPEARLNETAQNETMNKTANETVTLIIAGPCNGTTRQEVDECLNERGICWDIKNISLRDDCYYNSMNCSYVLDPDRNAQCTRKVKLMECEGSGDESFCKAMAMKDYTYCGTNADCITRFAYKTGNTEPCTLLGKIDNSTCIAVATGEYSNCYELELYEASQKECIKGFSKYTGVDGNICKELTTASYRDNCYYGVAEASGDYSNCLLIGSYNTHRDCLTTVAVKTVNASICDKMRLGSSSRQQRTDISFCKTRVAQINYKPWICQEVTDAEYKWGCFADSIITGKTKKEDCALIDNKTYPEWSAECFKRAV